MGEIYLGQRYHNIIINITTMSGLLSRNKGKRAERDVAVRLQGLVNRVYREHGLSPPMLQRNTLQAHMGGEDLVGLPWLAVEVKHHAKKQVPAWWRQTLEQAGDTKWPVLFYRGNHEAWTVRIVGGWYADLLVTPGVVDIPFDTFAVVFIKMLRQILADREV